jgi:hypothetical protein
VIETALTPQETQCKTKRRGAGDCHQAFHNNECPALKALL